jgi:hypothetical protein
LDSETTGIEATTKDLYRGKDDTEDWAWKEVPQITGMVPWLMFLYLGLFVFENDTESKESLEVYDFPKGCSKVCLSKYSRVLVIYKNI